MNLSNLQSVSYNCLIELSTEQGFNASGKNEAFGCIFGRDNFITILKILKAHQIKNNDILLAASKKTIFTHIGLQGKTVNIESGEQPGKFIHEFREDNYERLINRPRPWYVYPDNKLRNYDSIDSTPLGLIAIYKYWQITKDVDFLFKVLPSVEYGLNWIVAYGDMDKDTLLEYELPKNRKYGGLVVQSWADSAPSLWNEKGEMPSYPIAPIEVQGIAWLALKLWASFYTTELSEFHRPTFGKKLDRQAEELKRTFNSLYIIKSKGNYYGAQALDGYKGKIRTITANPLICLWAGFNKNGKYESIIEDKYIEEFVARAFKSDMFIKHAGIRTMSSLSKTFNPHQDSYHNGSFWPMLNGLIVEGLENFGFKDQARKLKTASLLPLLYFQSPIELYIEQNGSYLPYMNRFGQKSCFNQAWSAACAIDWLSSN